MEDATLNQIPKRIHYFWFGGNQLGEKELKCIDSWKRFLPDYEIVRWDETNFDVDCNPYISQAYKEEKWAFVSDYARFFVLYNQGGLYFDTDVELLKPLYPLLEQGPFLACEQDGNDIPWESLDSEQGIKINAGLGMYVEKGNAFCKAMLTSYQESAENHDLEPFENYTVVDRATDLLKSYGLKNMAEQQRVMNLNIYPAEFFCPKDFHTGHINITDNTYCFHHYHASWVDSSRQLEWELRDKLEENHINNRFSRKLIKIIAVIACLDVNRVLRRFTNHHKS